MLSLLSVLLLFSLFLAGHNRLSSQLFHVWQELRNCEWEGRLLLLDVARWLHSWPTADPGEPVELVERHEAAVYAEQAGVVAERFGMVEERRKHVMVTNGQGEVAEIVGPQQLCSGHDSEWVEWPALLSGEQISGSGSKSSVSGKSGFMKKSDIAGANREL